jgi:hypothetical protein
MIMRLTVFKEVHYTRQSKNGKSASESYDLPCMDNSSPASIAWRHINGLKSALSKTQ